MSPKSLEELKKHCIKDVDDSLSTYNCQSCHVNNEELFNFCVKNGYRFNYEKLFIELRKKKLEKLLK